MKPRFTQKDYILYLGYYEKVLKFLREGIADIEKAGKKTLWYFGAKNTLRHLEEEGGKNLTPHDVDNIIYFLLILIKQKEREKRKAK